jgi:hypothetical protein
VLLGASRRGASWGREGKRDDAVEKKQVTPFQMWGFIGSGEKKEEKKRQHHGDAPSGRGRRT